MPGLVSATAVSFICLFVVVVARMSTLILLIYSTAGADVILLSDAFSKSLATSSKNTNSRVSHCRFIRRICSIHLLQMNSAAGTTKYLGSEQKHSTTTETNTENITINTGRSLK